MDKDDDYEARKLEAMRPLMFEAGAALWDCQGFEYGLALQLYYFARLGVAALDAAALKRDDKRTAGQLVDMMKKHLLKSRITVTVNIETAIDEGLKARNLLIHRVLIDNAELFVNSESRAALVEKIRALRRKVNAADKKLRPVTALLSQLVDIAANSPHAQPSCSHITLFKHPLKLTMSASLPLPRRFPPLE